MINHRSSFEDILKRIVLECNPELLLRVHAIQSEIIQLNLTDDFAEKLITDDGNKLKQTIRDYNPFTFQIQYEDGIWRNLILISDYKSI